MSKKLPQHVLIVEHDFDFCEVLKKLLETEGFDVDLAFSTFDALSKIPLADVVITETKLLGIDHELIMKNAAFDGIPVVYLTADLNFEGPAEVTLYKPTSLGQLLYTMEQLMP